MGLYWKPFADFKDSEKIIIVNSFKGKFKCKSCNLYANNKFNLSYNKNNQRLLISKYVKRKIYYK